MSLWNNVTQNVTIWEAMNWARSALEDSGRPDAAIDARLLMLNVLGWDDIKLLLERGQVLEKAKLELYAKQVAIRQSGVPLQHITGIQEFMGLNFKVSADVLIPRQDTETLIEQLLEELKGIKSLKGIDIGTGSGCIGISLAYYIKDLSMTLVDISKAALLVANDNIKQHGLEDRVKSLESNLLESYKGEVVDFIVSNPPYISKTDMEGLMVEVKDHEPRLALTDEGDGLYFYRAISKEAKMHLKEKGLLAYEIGYNQGNEVTTILRDEGYYDIRLYKDLAGNDRVIIAKNK